MTCRAASCRPSGGHPLTPLPYPTSATCRRRLSQRIAAFGKRIVTEGDVLTDEVSTLAHALQRAQSGAAKRLPDDDAWVDVCKELEAARSVLSGNGPGGDL